MLFKGKKERHEKVRRLLKDPNQDGVVIILIFLFKQQVTIIKNDIRNTNSIQNLITQSLAEKIKREKSKQARKEDKRKRKKKMEPKQEGVEICGVDSLYKTLIPLLPEGAEGRVKSDKVKVEDLACMFELGPKSFPIFVDGVEPGKKKPLLKSIVDVSKSVLFSGNVTDDVIQDLFVKHPDCKSVKVDAGAQAFYYIRSMSQVVKTWKIDRNPLPPGYFAPRESDQEEMSLKRHEGHPQSSAPSYSSGRTEAYFYPPPHQFSDSPQPCYPRSPPFSWLGEKDSYSPPPFPAASRHGGPPPRKSSSTYGGVSTASKSTKPYGKPPCPYGSSCYRKNPEHFEKYSHPPMKSNTYRKNQSGYDGYDYEDDNNFSNKDKKKKKKKGGFFSNAWDVVLDFLDF